MRFRLLAVGRPRDAQAGALVERYAERIRRLGVEIETAWVPEVRPGGRFTDEHVREREAASILQKLDERERFVAVDPRGTAFRSEELPGRLEAWGRDRATFAIGGPLGLHGGLLERAEACWSLSTLTLPHELARVVVAEQIYRALTLLRGIPYHK